MDNDYSEMTGISGKPFMGFASAEELRKAIEAEEKYLKRQRVRGAILRNVPTVLFFFTGVGVSVFIQHLQ